MQRCRSFGDFWWRGDFILFLSFGIPKEVEIGDRLRTRSYRQCSDFLRRGDLKRDNLLYQWWDDWSFDDFEWSAGFQFHDLLDRWRRDSDFSHLEWTIGFQWDNLLDWWRDDWNVSDFVWRFGFKHDDLLNWRWGNRTGCDGVRDCWSVLYFFHSFQVLLMISFHSLQVFLMISIHFLHFFSFSIPLFHPIHEPFHGFFRRHHLSAFRGGVDPS